MEFRAAVISARHKRTGGRSGAGKAAIAGKRFDPTSAQLGTDPAVESNVERRLVDCLPGCPGVEVFDPDRLDPGGPPPGCRVVDELNLLLGISYTLESSLELRDVIRPVLLKMAEVLGMKRGTITILNRNQGEDTISEVVGMSPGREQEYLTACRELIRQVTGTGQAVVVQDISQDPLLKSLWAEESRPGASAAYICVPIRVGAEMMAP